MCLPPRKLYYTTTSHKEIRLHKIVIANCYKTQPNSKDTFIVQSIYKKGGGTNVIENKGNMPGICMDRASVDETFQESISTCSTWQSKEFITSVLESSVLHD